MLKFSYTKDTVSRSEIRVQHQVDEKALQVLACIVPLMITSVVAQFFFVCDFKGKYTLSEILH